LAGRLKLLEKQLNDAVTCETAALRLEAIGKEAVPVLKAGIKSTDPVAIAAIHQFLAFQRDAHQAPEHEHQ